MEQTGRMLCSGRVLAVSQHINPLFPYRFPHRSARFRHVKHELDSRWRSRVADPGSSSSSSSSSSFAASFDFDPTEKKTAGFCIIEGPETEQDFVAMELQEIQGCIRSRRNKIFLHMEELELKLGLGGTSYEDFIRSVHLPLQLSQVDPIVASFSGGAVGVISALMVVEINNVKQQEHKRCKYCLGTGYLACARCSSSGALVLIEPISTTDGGDQPVSPSKTERCSNCSGSGKVMCPTCLCTGMAMASEHDPRIDPFD
ncbi:hypothetical protein I3760_07G180800 [Carya illinoinensis]|uniref:Uncharacterized protein n=1 Tax=Carya illinoinensis TaxID=32201 RepID=A0A922EQ06_CARIL|nr:hypothetical protein I3760_07G180800 [Carya illinoinensis]KAG6705572.1 hypothetical protein I3842_07G185800 [Carya illinoinensis]